MITVKSSKSARSIDKKVSLLFGNRLRMIRKEKGLTQSDVALRCGKDYRFIGAIERGEQSPRLYTCWAIAKSINTPLHELMNF